IAVGPYLHRAQVSGVAEILILVDRVVYRAQVVAQLTLALRADAPARQRHRHAAQNQQDREGHDQLHERQSLLLPPSHTASIGRSRSCAGYRRPRAGPVNSEPTGWE